MYHFTIKDIEILCNIKAHTLRIWEQRYGLLLAKRKKSNHRIYDNEDLKKLLRISVLYHQGQKISKIAKLPPAAWLQLVENSNPGKDDYHFYITQLIEKALDFDKEGFVTQLDAVIEAMGFEDCIIQVCYPMLQKIGLLWMTERLIPAQEHFCSYIIQHKIIAETDRLAPPEQEAPEVVLFSPRGEHHELPLYFINYLLRKNGWITLFLGPSVKMELLKQFTPNANLKYLFLHITINFTGFILDDYFEGLCKTFPDKKIAASGAAVFGIQRQFTNLTLLKSDAEIYRFIQKKIPI